MCLFSLLCTAIWNHIYWSPLSQSTSPSAVILFNFPLIITSVSFATLSLLLMCLQFPHQPLSVHTLFSPYFFLQNKLARMEVGMILMVSRRQQLSWSLVDAAIPRCRNHPCRRQPSWPAVVAAEGSPVVGRPLPTPSPRFSCHQLTPSPVVSWLS